MIKRYIGPAIETARFDALSAMDSFTSGRWKIAPFDHLGIVSDIEHGIIDSRARIWEMAHIK